jgi:hypothetical protein
MASVLFPQKPVPLRPASESRLRAARASRHVALALALALPLIALAVWANHEGFVSPRVQWVVHRGQLVSSGPGVGNLQYAYPMLPVLLSILLPDKVLALPIVTCLFSGALLALLARWLAAPRNLVVLLPLVAVPVMWFVASELLPQVIALTFLVIALEAFLEFAARGVTYGGFVAGLALAVSYTADPGAVLYMLVMCLFVPVISARRYQGDPKATVGIWAVLAFPFLAVLLGWAFLMWKFTGSWHGNLAYSPNADVLAFPHGVLPGLGRALVSAGRDVLRAPLYVVAAALAAVRTRKPAIGVGLIFPVLMLALALWLGFDYSPDTAYFMLTLLAIGVSMEHKLMTVRWMWWVLLGAALLQVAIVYAWPPATLGFSLWWHAVFR